MLSEHTYENLILDEQYKLRITSKKLKSGNYQVKFFALLRGKKRELYGYLLVGSDETLKGVIQKIRRRLRSIDLNGDRTFNIYNMRNESIHEPNFMIFQ